MPILDLEAAAAYWEDTIRWDLRARFQTREFDQRSADETLERLLALARAARPPSQGGEDAPLTPVRGELSETEGGHGADRIRLRILDVWVAPRRGPVDTPVVSEHAASSEWIQPRSDGEVGEARIDRSYVERLLRLARETDDDATRGSLAAEVDRLMGICDLLLAELRELRDSVGIKQQTTYSIEVPARQLSLVAADGQAGPGQEPSAEPQEAAVLPGDDAREPPAGTREKRTKRGLVKQEESPSGGRG